MDAFKESRFVWEAMLSDLADHTYKLLGGAGNTLHGLRQFLHLLLADIRLHADFLCLVMHHIGGFTVRLYLLRYGCDTLHKIVNRTCLLRCSLRKILRA